MPFYELRANKVLNTPIWHVCSFESCLNRNLVAFDKFDVLLSDLQLKEKLTCDYEEQYIEWD
jgi:hypothetical protein